MSVALRQLAKDSKDPWQFAYEHLSLYHRGSGLRELLGIWYHEHKEKTHG